MERVATVKGNDVRRAQHTSALEVGYPASYACFRDGFISVVDIGLFRLRKTMVRRSRSKGFDSGHAMGSTLISGLDSGNMDFKVERSAMRIASSPNLRIATGLLLAVLLSVVGYQVVRRLNSHRPEALLKQADGLSWPDIEVQTSPFYIYEELGFNLPPVAAHETPTSQPLHAAIGSSVPVASRDRIADLRLPPDWSGTSSL